MQVLVKKEIAQQHELLKILMIRVDLGRLAITTFVRVGLSLLSRFLKVFF